MLFTLEIIVFVARRLTVEGIYTHDLIFNAHKPAYIRPSDPLPSAAAKSFAAAAAIAQANSDTKAKSYTNIDMKNSDVRDDNSTECNFDSAQEFLVNFERHRAAASIVKSLLRLLHASSKYNFEPIPHIVSKCLWMAALPDEEIMARSHSLV